MSLSVATEEICYQKEQYIISEDRKIVKVRDFHFLVVIGANQKIGGGAIKLITTQTLEFEI